MSKKRSQVTMAQTAMPTPERLRQAQGAFEIGGDKRSGKIFRMMDAPLEQMHLDHRVTELQYEALRRLRLHWFLGAMCGTTRSVDLNRVGGSDHALAHNERELMHRTAFDTGWRALVVTERGVVQIVVLAEMPLAVAGIALGYTSPYRGRMAALDHLRDAADHLVDAWRL